MTSRQPTRRFETRKAAIVSSAVDVLNRKGVRGMTLGEVAASLGLVPTGVIYYFKNKEALARACFLRSIERFTRIVTDAETGPTPRRRLEAFIQGFVESRRRIALGEDEPMAVFNDIRALGCPDVNAAFVDMFRRVRALLAGPETESWPRTALNARTHLLLSEMFWAVAWLSRRDLEDYSRISGRMAGMACDGLAAPGAPWAPIPLPGLMAATRDDPAELFLRAATELINEEGYVGASVEKISARLNVTKGAFYHHNHTKDELVEACFVRTFQVMRAAIRQAEAVASNGYQVLASVSAALVEYQMRGNAPLLRNSALTSVPEAIQPRLLDQFDRISERFASIVCDGIADGSIRPVDANIAAQMLTGMINAAAELRFWTPDADPQTIAKLYARPFFQGLLSTGGDEAA
ncbi:MAG TPA: TetR/AcrR family transcriptional regulator [Phenylobacterium sp.]|nr:TetR/AcrR family transcriptional regulator [Phenylobacterium sp.]